MYTIAELVKAAKNFGYSGALVEAALRMSGKTEFTIEEAQEIIRAFAETKVR